MAQGIGLYPTQQHVKDIYYATCSTAAATQTKAITLPEVTTLTTGLCVRVKFTNYQNYNGQPKLQINSLTAKNIVRNGTTAAARYEWAAGEVIDFCYDGTNFLIVDGGFASTTYYGYTKLSSSLTSTSEALALTPKAMNNFALNIAVGYPAYSSSATYAVGDKVRYSNNIYVCNTAITTAESWTAAHWTVLPALGLQLEEKYSEDNPPVRYGTIILAANSWTEEADGSYSQVVTSQISGTVTTKTKIDIQGSIAVCNQLRADGCSQLIPVQDGGVVTIYALDTAPTTAITIQYTREEVEI